MIHSELRDVPKLQEAESQIVIDYDVYDRRPSDTELLIPAIEAHEAKLGRTPRLVAADARFYSARNEAAAKAKGVKRVCIPNRSTKSASAGSAMARNDVRDARDVSASSSGVTGSIAAVTRAAPE